MTFLRSLFRRRAVLYFGSAWIDRDVDIYFAREIDLDEILFGAGEQ